MANAATPMEIDEFINGALVSWLESCLPRSEILTGYTSLLDGSIIHSVWLQIDPEPQQCPNKILESSGVTLCIARAKNFEIIVRNLKSLYEEELGQTLLVLPDAYALGYYPESKFGLEQMKILLNLLLGAAVQCPNKELFIARIKELDLETQHAIVEHIKQVTDNQSLVLTDEAITTSTTASLYQQIVRLIKERDDFYLKWISSVFSDPETNSQCGVENSTNLPLSPASGISNVTTTSASNSENNHMAVELADLKSKLRKLRQELEEKTESQLELREELEHKTSQYEKLRQESQEWHSEAKRAAAYRDENDILRDRAERADRLETEIQKLREKLTDAEFYKARVEELREDNRMLTETKEMLEDQLQHSRKRSEHVMFLETEILKYKQKINDMVLERGADRSRMEELIEENSQLQLAAKNISTTHDFDKSLIDSEDDCNSGDNSLSEQLTNNAQTRALKLELENRRLLAALDQMKESSFHESTNKILELEKEKKRLQLKVDNLNENIQRMSNQNNELEKNFKNALEENKKLQDTMDNRQKSYDRQSLEREAERAKLIDLEKQVETLVKEKQRVQNLNESIQRRADDLERLADSRTKEIDQLMEKAKDFEKTKQDLYDLESKQNIFERENVSLTKEVNKLKEMLEEKSVQLDESSIELETKTKELLKMSKAVEEVEQIHQKLGELEKQNQDLVSQREIDLQTITTLQNDLFNGTLATNKVRHNFEKLGISVDENEDGSDLNVETVVEKLVRNPETFKTVREIMLNVTREQQQQLVQNSCNAKSDMCVLSHRKEIFTVEKNIELSPSEAQELNFEHKVIRINKNNNMSQNKERENAEFDRLSEDNTQLNALNQALQTNNEQLHNENARLQVDVATLSSQITSLNAQHVALQLANTQLAADKNFLLEQIETVRLEHKNALHDQRTLQCLHDQLSAEYESLTKSKEQLRVLIRDLRNETREQKERIICLENQIEELTKQNATMKSCAEDLAILRTEHSKLTDDFRNLFTTNDRLKNEYKNIQEQYKMIRMENSKLKLQTTELSGELNSKSDQLRMLEIDYNNVAQRCESLLQANADLQLDRKALMDNVSTVFSQYHELLSHSLEEKQSFHEEEKNYTERLHNLSRQKEKLEEKIMEQYKQFAHNVPKKKPFAASLVRRVKKASSDLINKGRRSWVEDSRMSQSQFIIGSESGGNDSDNSTEEPHSIATDTLELQRNIPMRQSLQRDCLDSSLVRGGMMRSSLQAQAQPQSQTQTQTQTPQQQQHQHNNNKRLDLNNSRRNSVHGLEAPDVTGSSLTLGTAGSRRTVYLIDENQKLPDPNASAAAPAANTNSTAATTSTSSATISAAEPQTPTNISSPNINNNGLNKAESPAPTFLMYNRIHTTIGGNGGANSGPMSLPNLDQNNISTMTSSTHSNNGAPASSTHSQDDKALRKRTEDKSNSVWYEYGCV